MKKILIGIFLLAFFIRIAYVGSYPLSLSMDELSIGYNAYSISEIGMDEWGVRYPLVFRSLSDYKPPVSVYLVAISVRLFGLNEFSVRFPNVLIGSLSVLVFFGLLRELKFNKTISLVGAAWLAINPWHVFYSRAGFETLIALFFVIAGIWFFLRGVSRKSSLILSLSAIAFSLSVWTYHAERIYVPILVFILVVLKRKELLVMLKAQKIKLIFPFLTTILFAAPFIYMCVFAGDTTARAFSTSLLRDFHLTGSLHAHGYSDVLDMIFNNDIFLIFRHFLGKYLNYIDVEFLFKNGLHLTLPEYPGMGLLYLVDLPVVLVGVCSVVTHKSTFLKKITLALFFLGPLAAASTLDEQHTLRALTWLPFWGIIFVSGVDYVVKQRIRLIKPVVAFYSLALLLNFTYFADMYVRQFPYFYSELWLYGYKEASILACAEKDNYDYIVLTDTFGQDGPLYTGVPYEYVLFYCNIHPSEFLANGRKIPKILMRRPDWPSDVKKDMLVIAAPYDFPLDQIDQKQIVKTISYYNGKKAFIAVTTRLNEE